MWKKKKYLCRFFYLSCCSAHIFTKNQSRITNFHKSYTQNKYGFALTIEIVLLKQQQTRLANLIGQKFEKKNMNSGYSFCEKHVVSS